MPRKFFVSTHAAGTEPLFHYLHAGGMSQPVETETHCAGIRDADSLDGLNISSSVESLVVKELFPITDVAPWRAKQPLTVRLVAQCLRMKFSGLAFRDSFNRKSSTFTFPNSAATEDCGCSAVISSRQQEFLSFQFQLCHRSGDARG